MTAKTSTGLFGDTPKRTYSSKLEMFNWFAEPELRQMVADLGLKPGDRVLDAGCGVGLITGWIAERVVPGGVAVGLDLATDHIQAANRIATENRSLATFQQGDMAQPPFDRESFDWVWTSNAISHLRDPVAGIRTLSKVLRAGGHLVLGQSAFLPDMFFAWDARLEKEVMLACRQYFRDKYQLKEEETTAVRNLFGWLIEAGLRDVRVRTYVIERVAPLTETEEHYFLECVFKSYWGHRLQPYLTPQDWEEVTRLCDPESPSYCLRRPDFHHVQTFTLAIGQK